MSRAARTPLPSQPERAPVRQTGIEVALSPVGITRWIWRLFTSMRFGLALLLALAVLALIGTLLAQAPAAVRSDSQAYAAWLDSIHSKYGGWTGIFDRLGLFAIFSSLWFRALVVLLAVSILACSVRWAPRLWRKAVHPRTIMPDQFFDGAPLGVRMASKDDPDDVLAALLPTFRSRGFHAIVDRDGETVHVCADRFRWGPFGRVVAHLSFVIILVGALIGATWGFRDEEFAVAVGSKVPVGYGTGMSIEARSFSDSYYADGAPRDYSSTLVLYKDGVPVRSQVVRVNHPLRYGGVSFYQSFFGPAAVMRVTDRDGTALFDRGVPLLWGSDDGAHRIGRFTIPERDLTVFVVGAASGEVDPSIAAGQMQLEVYKGGEENPVAVEVVDQGKPVQIAGIDFTFSRERQFTGLIVSRDPGVLVVWIGGALLVLGTCVVFFFRHRRVRAMIRPTGAGSELRVAATWRRDAGFQPLFERLVEDIAVAFEREHPPQLRR